MKTKMIYKHFALLSLLLLLCKGPGGYLTGYIPLEGDIIFQSLSKFPLVNTIEGVSQSYYSHCGIIIKKGNEWYVLEAIGPVIKTKLDDYLGRGRGKAADIFRLKEQYSDLITQFIAAAEKYMGVPYDIKYELDDDKIYCSELIYKAFKETYGEELGKLEKLGNLNWKPYKEIIMKIEDGPVPIDRKIITPRAIAEAEQLKIVYKGINKNPNQR